MSNKVNRRDFLKIGGISTGVALGSTLVNPIKKASALTSNDLKYIDRSNRYPWWVKEVDEPTNEYDLDSLTQFPARDTCNAGRYVPSNIDLNDFEPPNYGIAKHLGAEKYKNLLLNQQDVIKDNIENKVPGYSLQDRALLDSVSTSMINSYFNTPQKANNVKSELSEHILTPEQRGVERWKGTEEEASVMLESAAKMFGVEQVAYCAVEPKFMYDHIKFSSSVDEITQKDGKQILPERFKYVINLGIPMPLEVSKRVPSNIGSCGDRITVGRLQWAGLMLQNFIKSLGYQSMILSGNFVAHSILAGMGELGRMNRCISPIYGGNLRTWCLVTDMPLAIDKPIDFGLQEFCKGCKICATECPSGAIPKGDEPFISDYPWTQTKKAYHEDGTKCISYFYENGSLCAVCGVSCPWSRPIGSALHDLSGPVGATIPGASSLLAKMHDVFGYGIQNDAESQSEWWKLVLPPYGYGKFENRGL